MRISGWAGAVLCAAFVAATPAIATEYHINCNGPDYTTVGGTLFEADRPYVAGDGGWTNFGFEEDTWQVVGGSPDPELYETIRGNFAYQFDVPNGSYVVTFHVIDFFSHGPRQSQFDIYLEGAIVVEDLDVFALVGKNYAVDFSFAVDVSDGTINVSHHIDRHLAYLAAISVLPRAPDGVAPDAPVGVTALSSYNRNSIKWDVVPGDDIAGYRIQRRVSPSGGWFPLTSDLIPVPWSHDTGATIGTPYDYRIAAEDVFGNVGPWTESGPATARSIASSTLPVAEILMSEASLDSLNSDTGTAGDDYFSGTLIFDGTVYSNARIRYRGNVTRQLPKKSWKVRLDGADTIDGTDRINVNAEWPDRSLLRQQLAYQQSDIYDVPRPRNEYNLVTLNGEFLGVHNRIQQMDEVFLAESGLDPDGDLYKAEGNLAPLGSVEDYEATYEKQTNETTGHGELITLIELIAATTEETVFSDLAPVMDLDGVIKWYGINTMISNQDFAWKNYYLYQDPTTARWQILPWDVDFTWGKDDILENGFRTNASIYYGGTHRLLNRVLNTPSLRRKYLECLVSLATDEFTPEKLDPQVAALVAEIENDVPLDWLKMGWQSDQSFLDAPDDFHAYFVGRAPFVLDHANRPTGIDDDNLVINEYLASNTSGATDNFGEYEDWIEIYNGGDVAQDLTGMFLTDDPLNTTKWEITNLVLQPGGYALFWADAAVGQGPMHTNFALDRDGEFVGLFASIADDNIPIDFEWFGPQLQDVSRGRSPDGSLYWSPFGNPSPGGAVSGAPNLPPEITDVRHTPVIPSDDDAVTFLATIVDPDGLAITRAVLDVDGSPDTVSVFDDGAHGDGAAGDGVFGGVHAPFVDGSHVQYFVEAIDGAGVRATDPITAPDARYEFVVGYSVPQLRVNEIMASNGSTIADEAGQFDDWIEIVNIGDSVVDLGGMHLTDDEADSTKWTFPVTSLGIGEHLVVWCDDDPTQGPLHATFKLAAAGEEIAIFERVGLGGAKVDLVTFGPQTTDISYGRFPDGSDDFQFFGLPTPGSTNTPGNAPPLISDTIIRPNPPEPAVPVNVDAEIWDDSAVVSAAVLYNPQGDGDDTWLSATMYDDGVHGDGLPGDRLYSGELPAFADGTIVDFVITATDDEGITATDPAAGTAAPYGFEVGYEPPALYVNEILALNGSINQDEFGDFDDWLELYNGDPSPIALGGLFLSDDASRPTRWALPEVTLNPGEFLLIWCDGEEAEGTFHAPFRLSSNGEVVGVFEGMDRFYAPLDFVTFGPQTVDIAYARYPDGGPLLFTDTPTPGGPNAAVDVGSPVVPLRSGLIPPSPNPFRAGTRLRYVLERDGEVELRVFDVQGRAVRTLLHEIVAAGTYELVWDGRSSTGRSLAPGVYFVRLATPNRTSVEKVVRSR